jgi:hypothetical protein
METQNIYFHHALGNNNNNNKYYHNELMKLFRLLPNYYNYDDFPTFQPSYFSQNFISLFYFEDYLMTKNRPTLG